jgi:Ca-activated chloride channel family protein
VPALILAVVIVLLAGPQQLSAPRTKRVLTNIEFCVDVSSSMRTPLGDGSRYDSSMKAIDSFLDIRKGDAFGLTFFGNNVLHWVPLTSDPSAIRCAPPFMKPENVPIWMGGTMIGKALLACK